MALNSASFKSNKGRNIKYLNKDFAQFRENLIEYSKTYFPKTYSDFNEASPGMMFIEMAAYVGDVLSYYIDDTLKESMMLYAEDKENVLALSQYLGPESEKMSNPFNPAIHNGLSVIRKILNKDEHTEGGYKVFYNVNFPPTEIIKGVAVVPQGLRPNTTFGVTPFNTHSGKKFLFIKGGNQHSKVTQKSDVAANLSGYISLTPMRADLTAIDRMADFEEDP